MSQCTSAQARYSISAQSGRLVCVLNKTNHQGGDTGNLPVPNHCAVPGFPLFDSDLGTDRPAKKAHLSGGRTMTPKWVREIVA